MSNPTLRRGIVDTPILVGIRLGDPDPIQFAMDMLATSRIEMSQFSSMVLVSRCGDLAELVQLKDFLNNNRVHSITSRIVNHAVRILETIPPPSPLSPADAIIAATALIHKLPLYTFDPNRFGIVPGLNCIQPY